jgi:adenylate cyclase
VTSLFTDIEGFTQASTLLEPETVVRLLDGYFEGVARLIHARGGMIDKFVGDAVHAFFGMPLDLENHVGQAIGCACDIVSWTENYRRRDDIAKHGLGRTRIGIESGLVVAGEVGAGEKLDYTAYGDSVNLASRLEAANKRLGTAICVGPEAARLAPEGLLRPIGRLTIVGLTHELDVFGPWPPESDADWRRAYLEAWEFAKRGDPASRPAFARLGEQAPSDPVCKRCAEESA